MESEIGFSNDNFILNLPGLKMTLVSFISHNSSLFFDMLIASLDINEINVLKRQLFSEFAMKDLGSEK